MYNQQNFIVHSSGVWEASEQNATDVTGERLYLLVDSIHAVRSKKALHSLSSVLAPVHEDSILRTQLS